MISVSLRHMPLLDVAGEKPGEVYHGFDQEWYPTSWQRRAGCGPTVASQVVFYCTRVKQDDPPVRPPRHTAVALMEDVWRFVTPTVRGIPNTKLLCDGFSAYARERNLPLRPESLDIPRRRNDRPDFAAVLEFIASSLRADMPVAFLNLHNGAESVLDSWHWVLMAALSYEPGGAASAVVLDEGLEKTIDLALWFSTTMLGGGFVRFQPQ